MPALPQEVDVLIAGYGPVGAALAALLGRAGIRTLAVDRAPDIYPGPRAIALDNEALRILQWIGVVDAIDTLPIPRIEMYSPYVGHFSTLRTDVLIDGHPKLAMFYQPQFDRALRDRAQSWPSVTAATSTQFEGFVEDAQGALATLRTPDDAAHIVRARFLVGADGANSRVREALGLKMQGESFDEDWLIIDAQGVPDNIDHVEFLCNPRRPIPHMPAPGGRTRWEFMLQPGETREHMERDDTIRALLSPWPGASSSRIERKAVYRFQARSCERYGRGRVFLCGDAAHVTPPFAGQGLVSGLRDAANLAWKLAWVVRGHADITILESYDEERRPHATAMIRLAQDMGAMIMPRTLLKAILVQGMQKLLRLIPPVRRYLESWGPKPKNEFASGLFVSAGGRLKHGAPLPQLRIDGQLSDELLVHGLALVGYDVAPQLGDQAAAAWRRCGGVILALPRAAAPPGMPPPWCAVLRPDLVVMHDGPAAEADRLVLESVALLEKGA